MGVTIKDIAREAGVSYSTVSKALRDSPLVKPPTKKKIQEIALKLGYQPNAAARSLVSKKSYTIGVAWPSVERVAQAALITRINDKLEQKNYTTLLSINKITQALNTFQRFQVDAILIFNEQKELMQMNSKTIPVLTYGIAENSIYPSVDVNRKKAIHLSVNHFISAGHEKIAFIGSCSDNDPLQEHKLIGFKEGLNNNGLDINPENIIDSGGLDMYDGYLAVKKLLSREILPTALIVASFDLTRGATRAINECSRSEVDSIEIISYDNIPQMRNFKRPIITVGVPLEKIVDVIVEHLISMIETDIPVISIKLEPELIRIN